MTNIKAEQLDNLMNTVDRMILWLECNDKRKSARFLPILKVMSHNLSQCISNQFDGIEELQQYLREDWRSVCVGKSGIENWHLLLSDLFEMETENQNFESMALAVDNILGTQYLNPKHWILPRNWKQMAKDEEAEAIFWELVQDLQKEYHLRNIQKNVLHNGIPEDIYFFAKWIGVADEEHLEDWFESAIPAWGYVSSKQILQMEQGERILRILMSHMEI